MRCMDKVMITLTNNTQTEKPKDTACFTRHLFEKGKKIKERPE